MKSRSFGFGFGFGVKLGSGVFNPVELFAELSNGLMIEADIDQLYQDVGGETPVTESGQQAARVNDKSGFNNDFDVLSGAVAATYESNNGLPVLRFTSDGYKSISSFDISYTDKATVYVIGSAGVSADQTFIEHTVNAGGIDGGFLAFQGDTTQRHAQCLIRGNSQLSYSEAGMVYPGVNVITHVIDKSLSSARTKSYLNGREFTSTPLDNASVGNFANATAYIGARTSSSNFLDGDIHAILVYPGVVHDQTTRNQVEEYYAAKIFYEWLNENNITDSNNESFADYIMTSPFGRTKFNTSATTVDVVSYSNIWSVFPAYAEVYVMIDGVLHQTLAHAANGSRTDTVTMPAGQKVVELVSGVTTKPSGTVLGTFCIGAKFGDNAKAVTEDGGGLVFYGDSITAGDSATTPGSEAYVPLVRSAASYQIGAEAWGFRSLNEDAVDTPTLNAFIRKLVSYNPSIVYLQIGTNDYGLNKWSAANFGTAYAATLDAIHAQFPNAAIYAQSPIVRTTETANSFGDTLQDYRDEILTVAAARAWVTYVEGSTILTTGDLADGVHPTTAGHSKYADSIKTTLGIT